MSRRRIRLSLPVLRDIGVALVTSAYALGPAALLLWFNWRAAIFGATTLCCLGLYPLTMLAAGNMGWQPTRTSPRHVLAIGWAVASAGLILSLYLIAPTILGRVLWLPVGIAVAVWTTTRAGLAQTCWAVIGLPD